MIYRCSESDLQEIWEIINERAKAHQGIIPADRYKSPYMSAEELQLETTDGVVYWGFEDGNGLLGVLGVRRCWI